MSVPPDRPPVYPPPGSPVDQPTAPLDPVAARPAPGPYREAYVADPRPAAWRLEGLRTALTIVGLVALAAIALSVWALIRSNQNHGRVVAGDPANTAALVALNRRVNSLDATLSAIRATGGTHGAGTQALSTRLAALQQSEKQLAAQVGHAGGSGTGAKVAQLTSKYAALSSKVSQWVGKEAALSGQVSQLQGRVAQLAGQVSQLRAQQNSQTTTVGTTTTGP